jgi:hypothetical protein
LDFDMLSDPGNALVNSVCSMSYPAGRLAVLR